MSSRNPTESCRGVERPLPREYGWNSTLRGIRAMIGLVGQVLGVVTVLIGFSLQASAAAMVAAPTDGGSMVLIGGGLILGASIVRSRTRRG